MRKQQFLSLLAAAGAVLVVAAILLVAVPVLAIAQAIEVGTTPVVTVGQAVNPWIQAVVAIAGTLITAFAGIAVTIFNKKAGLENDANVKQIEKMAMETLQSALTNAAGKVVISLGEKLDKVPLLPNNPAIAKAVLSVSEAAGEARDRFGLSDSKVAEMVINKIGVITASNPAVAPTSDPALVQKS